MHGQRGPVMGLQYLRPAEQGYIVNNAVKRREINAGKYELR